MLALCGSLALLFAGLGVWQVERLAWKRQLVARVEARVEAAPVPLASVRPGDVEYLRVQARGRFDHGRETLVDALTERGKGFWVLTPLIAPGRTVLVNRGFVPTELASPARRASGQVAGEITVIGLLRLTEPHGRFLRANVPAEDRFYSRDVAAIAAKRGLARVDPWFIDAEAAPFRGGYPVGGLTVIRFANNHLIYALTWFGLSTLSLVGLVLTLRSTHNRD